MNGITTIWWLLLCLQPSPDPLFTAIRQVESGGMFMALGDGGWSVGCYQIGQAYWIDGCDYGGVDWDYGLALIPRYAEQVMRWYWKRYGASTDEQRARMHCAGPDGPAQVCSLSYWMKIHRTISERLHEKGGRLTY